MSSFICKDETKLKGGLTMGHINYGTYNYHTFKPEDVNKAIVALLAYKGLSIDQIIEIQRKIEEMGR